MEYVSMKPYSKTQGRREYLYCRFYREAFTAARAAGLREGGSGYREDGS
ncbi:MAG TPA: hypothetical protein H9935_06565 [Candidatus Blautia merdigallinarum]|uniref:Uncharacterized protein n=1 Tax=Candidatus Blautia merdigallinarum TaxID=2838495 RepID=A0A9D2N685_9FIRM|nr:hypothetical protein [Candidatus Blautia merdigallinarum]